MTSPFPAYEGDGPYLFVSYAHVDAERIYPEMAFLHNAGVNIWYDEGITPGSRWSDELANAIDHASLFLVFLTEAAVQSENCLNEMDFALRRQRPFLAVELEPVILPPGIELNIGNRQSILRHQLDEADYRARLLDAIRRSRGGQTSMRGNSLAHAPAINTAKRRNNRLLPLLAAAGLALLLVIVGYYMSREEKTLTTRVDTIAVLPFANLTQDPELDYLADGLADELITALGSIDALSVSSRTSSFFFRNQTAQIHDIRERLGVGHAVEGSLRTAPGGISVNVSVFETSQGRQVWSEQFSTETREVSEISGEITMAIVRALNPGLDLSQFQQRTQTARTSSDAYQAYLKGLGFLAQPPKPETLDAAVLFFESALNLEPTFARAAAALCETHLAYYRMARTDDIQSRYETAARQCEAAVALDATLWSGRAALAALYRHSGRFSEALREIRLADTLQPDTASVQHEYGKILTELGEVDEAEKRLRRGIELDPGFWGGYADLGDYLYMQGRYEEALAQFQKTLALSPDNDLMAVSLGACYYMLDDPEKAHLAWKEAIRKNPDSSSRAFWQSATWLGINSLNQNCPEEAAYWQQQAITVSPEDHRLWGRLAESCQMQQEDPAQPQDPARQAYQHAIELAGAELEANPNDWETLGLMAVYQARLSQVTSAPALIERMLELQPDNPDALEAALFFYDQQDDRHRVESLKKRLLALNFPSSLFDRNPYLAGKQTCQSRTDEKERLICAQGRIIPALRN